MLWSPNHWLSREFSKLSFILQLISLRPQTSHSSKGSAMASTLPRPGARPWTPLQGLTLSTPPPSSDSFLTQAPRLALFLLHGLCLLSVLWERLPFRSSKGGVSLRLHPLLRWVKSHGSSGLNDINTLRVPNTISAVNTLDVSGPKLESPLPLRPTPHIQSNSWCVSRGCTFRTYSKSNHFSAPSLLPS